MNNKNFRRSNASRYRSRVANRKVASASEGLANEILKDHGSDLKEIQRMIMTDFWGLLNEATEFHGASLDEAMSAIDILTQMSKSARRANRKVAEYDPTDVFYNEGVWEVANEVWDSRLLDYDVTDDMIEEKIREYSEFFLGQQADQTFVDMVMEILNANRSRTSHRASRKVAQEYNGWFNWDTWAAYGSITADYDDYQKGIAATRSGDPLDLIAVFENSVYREPDVDVSEVDWDEVYFALEEDN